jgi:hypothetical protein
MKTHTANVQIHNDTKKQISTVAVYHKYDDFKDRNRWDGFLNQGNSTDNLMEVNYKTGFGGTSKDWWYVTWQYSGENKVYYTDPENGQNFFSFFKNIKDDIDLAIDSVEDAEGDEEALAKIEKTATAMMIENIKNGDGGLKQCNLESKDANKPVLITINSDNTVHFGIHSGSCDTGSSTHISGDSNDS